MNIIGRIAEQKILGAKLTTTESELIAIYGRRRVGKTYLVRTFCKNNIIFEFTGIHQATMKTQLENFSQTLQLAIKSAVVFGYSDQLAAGIYDVGYLSPHPCF